MRYLRCGTACIYGKIRPIARTFIEARGQAPRLTICPNHSLMNQMQTGRNGRRLPPGQFDSQGASMKIAFLLLTSSLVIGASGAFAQGNSDACHNQYASCMERCSTRPQALQES